MVLEPRIGRAHNEVEFVSGFSPKAGTSSRSRAPADATASYRTPPRTSVRPQPTSRTSSALSRFRLNGIQGAPSLKPRG